MALRHLGGNSTKIDGMSLHIGCGSLYDSRKQRHGMEEDDKGRKVQNHHYPASQRIITRRQGNKRTSVKQKRLSRLLNLDINTWRISQRRLILGG